MSEEQYRRRIFHERSLAQAYLGVALDQLCRDYGLPTWRHLGGVISEDRP